MTTFIKRILVTWLLALSACDPKVCGEPGTPPCDDDQADEAEEGVEEGTKFDMGETPDAGDDAGVCCLCHVPGVPPAWCGPQIGPQPETAEECEALGADLLASSSEWHEECELGQPCPGACEP